MKAANLLGISQDSITSIFDILMEEHGFTNFNVFPNIKTEIKPFLPIKEIPYEIKGLNEKINPTENVFFGLASPRNKEIVFDSFLKTQNINKERYSTIIHQKTYVASSSKIDNGVLIESSVVIGSQSHIGFGVFVKRGSLVGHHNSIGDFTDINPGVVLSGKITIGKGCIIGSGAVIKDNITIGENTIIGVGSVVTKDIPANSVAFGNPCKVVRANN